MRRHSAGFLSSVHYSSFSSADYCATALSAHLLLVMILVFNLLFQSTTSTAAAVKSGTATGRKILSQALSLDDLIIVTPSSRARLPMVHAARHFRAGVRTFILVQSVELAQEQNRSPVARRFKETYAYYPGERMAGGRHLAWA